MYRFLIDLRTYLGNIHGMVALFTGVLLAVAFYVLFVGPLHNCVKYSVASKRGDSIFKEYGLGTMSPREHFHLVGFITTLLLNISFTQPVYIDDENLKKPKQSRVLIALSGLGVYVFMFLVSGVAYSFLKHANIFSIQAATVVPDNVSFFAYAYYALYVAVFYVFRISICSIFLNLIPLGPLDAADILYMFLPVNWQDGMRNNDSLISLLLFILVFLTVGAPDGVFNVVGNEVMLEFSNMIMSWL